ncbi:hypothetical protein M8J77_016514 [Diaphorina citri]|nr:hypothetical protein M8J77_016514 [Diaphorina citri]
MVLSSRNRREKEDRIGESQHPNIWIAQSALNSDEKRDHINALSKLNMINGYTHKWNNNTTNNNNNNNRNNNKNTNKAWLDH